jgi:mycothione reductase
VGEKTILIGDNEKMTAENILIASGTRPQIPKKIKGLEGSSYITSNEALRLKKQPRVITFIGGGYITCELAHFLALLEQKLT